MEYINSDYIFKFDFVSDINLHNTVIFYEKYKNIQMYPFYDFKMN